MFETDRPTPPAAFEMRAQRLSVSSGLAANQSMMQEGVAEGLGWITGRFGIVSGSGSSSRRLSVASTEARGGGGGKGKGGDQQQRQQEQDAGPTNYEQLLDTLIAGMLVLVALAAFRVAILVYWNRFANVQYYIEQNEGVRFETPSPTKGGGSHRDLQKQNQEQKKRRPATFLALPAALVFPNLEFAIFGLFSISVNEAAVAALCDESCGHACSVLASLVLFETTQVMVLAFVLILRFQLRYRSSSWLKKSADSFREVDDPLLRLVSKVRFRCGLAPLPRSLGEYQKSEADAAEPARTERLLALPFGLFRENSGDAYDALTLLWLSRSSGSVVGVFYDFVFFMTSALLGIAYGLKSVAQDHGDSGVIAQTAAVFILQTVLVLYIFVLRPSSDRIENVQSWFQVTLEATSTLLLLLPLIGFWTDSDFTFSSFLLATSAVVVPILGSIYDGILAPLINWRLAGGTMSSLGVECVQMLFAVPGLILRLYGFADTAEVTGLMSGEASAVTARRLSRHATDDGNSSVDAADCQAAELSAVSNTTDAVQAAAQQRRSGESSGGDEAAAPTHKVECSRTAAELELADFIRRRSHESGGAQEAVDSTHTDQERRVWEAQYHFLERASRQILNEQARWVVSDSTETNCVDFAEVTNKGSRTGM